MYQSGVVVFLLAWDDCTACLSTWSDVYVCVPMVMGVCLPEVSMHGGWLCVALVTVYAYLYAQVYQSEDAVYACLPACGG